MTYGGIVQSLTMPDKNGKFADIVLGFDNLDGYTSPPISRVVRISARSSAATATASAARSSRWKARPTRSPSNNNGNIAARRLEGV